MREYTLTGEVRKQMGSHSRALRRSGQIPGIYYLRGESNIPISVPTKSLLPLINSAETHIINLTLGEGGNKSCILRDIQFDPVTDVPVHFDLQGVRENEKINVEVPVVITGGIPIGVREGGILQHVIHRLKISCLPKDIPEHIEVNAEELKINRFVHVRDLKIDKVTILDNESSTIVGVVPPTVEKEEVAAVAPGAEEAVEPEVIAKGKKPEEGAAPAEGEKKPAEAGAAKPTAGAKPAGGEEKKEKK